MSPVSGAQTECPQDSLLKERKHTVVNDKDTFVNDNDLVVNSRDLFIYRKDLVLYGKDIVVNDNDLLVNGKYIVVNGWELGVNGKRMCVWNEPSVRRISNSVSVVLACVRLWLCRPNRDAQSRPQT